MAREGLLVEHNYLLETLGEGGRVVREVGQPSQDSKVVNILLKFTFAVRAVLENGEGGGGGLVRGGRRFTNDNFGKGLGGGNLLNEQLVEIGDGLDFFEIGVTDVVLEFLYPGNDVVRHGDALVHVRLVVPVNIEGDAMRRRGGGLGRGGTTGTAGGSGLGGGLGRGGTTGTAGGTGDTGRFGGGSVGLALISAGADTTLEGRAKAAGDKVLAFIL
mmetsp:Transcript_29302/g.85190  ORF Transcript_29302/g.85190 Transcript_29302/m.85190 type:complete len:216 (+) Transcript_29302:412-1059(+)